MSDNNETGDNTPSGERKPLRLKGGTLGAGTVRQNFSHGRTKSVVVEKRRKRVIAPKDGAKKPEEQEAAPVEAPKEAKQTPDAAPEADKSGAVLRTLTETEKQARAVAVEEAKVREEEDRKQAVVDAKRREEEEKVQAAQRAEVEKQATEEAARLAIEMEAKAQAEEKSGRRAMKAEEPSAKATPATADEGAKARRKAQDEESVARSKRKTGTTKQPARPRSEPRRRAGKLTIARALDDNERTRSLAAMRRAREKERREARGIVEAPKQVFREVTIPETITIRDLADRMATRSVDLVKVMMKQGTMATVNDVVDADTAQLLAEEFGHTVKRVAESDVEEGLMGPEDDEATLVARAPVVTVMGHVDHGKTSLLDAIRQDDVAAGEAGGITQHIGAYQVSLESGQKITFLDTPGHAAFTEMRARGAKVTDIVVLVVAGDDGVMPQTVEALNHAKAAEVPIIIAINKMDKPGADANRVKQELLQHELVVEDMGGDIQTVEVSAIQKTGLAELEESILLQAEILELKANPNRNAVGSVVEAKLDKGRGPIATVLIQRGTLRNGDVFVSGSEWGKVRAMLNDRGENVEESGPAVPVEVLGINGTPLAGDDFVVVESEARAREIAGYRERKERDAKSAASTTQRGSLEQMLEQLKETDAKEVPLVIKADVQGSVEAIVGAFDNLSTDEVMAKAIHRAVGGITESDVILAKASTAPIIGFNVRANRQARDMADRESVEIRYYSVIYDLVDDVKAAMSGLLEPTIREHFLGNAEIREVFNVSKVGRVAGCLVTEGQVKRGSKVRLIRDDVVIHEGTLSTLKRFKDEVRDVQSGQECGMAFENYQDIQKGDVIECFDVEEIARTL